MDITLNKLFGLYLKDLKRRNKKTIDETKRFYDKDVRRTLGRKKIKEIKRLDVLNLFNKITDRTPDVANRCLSIINAVLNLAIENELLEHNVCNIKRNRETERKRYYSHDELKRIFDALKEKEKNPRNQASVSFIKLLIYTGCRVSEIRKATWGDLKDNMITLQEHKTDDKDDARVIHLNSQAMTVINKLERKEDHVRILGISAPKRLWYSIRKTTGCSDLRLHDLRHSFATMALSTKKISLPEIGNLLGHKDIKSTARYTHVMEETAKQNAKDVGNEIFNSIN